MADEAERVLGMLAQRILELEGESVELEHDDLAVAQLELEVVDRLVEPGPVGPSGTQLKTEVGAGGDSDCVTVPEQPDVTDSETQRYIDAHKNANTSRKTESDLRKFRSFVEKNGVVEKIEDIQAERLDMLIAKFIMTTKKGDGSDFEPSSVDGIHSSLCRYLKEKNYTENIKNSLLFHHSRQVMYSKQKELKSKGLGNRKRKAEALSDQELSKMWSTGVLGTDNPQAIINTLFLSMAMGFGTRGRQEHQSMLWGDVELLQTSSGQEYLAFTERATKTRNGSAGAGVKDVPKIFAQPGNPRCPVYIYKEYMSHRPTSTLAADSKFYLSLLHNPTGDIWYKTQAMGVNKIGNLMKDMASAAELTGRKTNHSSRHTLAKSLKKAGVQDTDIIQLTGHKTVQGLVPYSSMGIEEQQSVSSIITEKIAQLPDNTVLSTTSWPTDDTISDEIPDDLLLQVPLDGHDHGIGDLNIENPARPASQMLQSVENRPVCLSFANANIANINITFSK